MCRMAGEWRPFLMAVAVMVGLVLVLGLVVWAWRGGGFVGAAFVAWLVFLLVIGVLNCTGVIYLPDDCGHAIAC